MKRLALLLSILAIALFAACGDQADEAAPAPEADTDEAAMVEVTITNGLELWSIHSVLIDPSDETWGEERLGADEVLAPEKSFSIEIEAGTWDIMVIDEDGDSYSLWQVEIGPEGYEWTVTLEDLDTGWDEEEFIEPLVYETGEGSAWVSITNDLDGWNIFWVYIDPVNEPWGEDLLGSDILYDNDQLIVWLDPGIYDIKVEDEDGDTYTLWEVEVDETGFDWYVTLDDMDPFLTDEAPEGVVLDTGDGMSPVTVINDLDGWDIMFVYVDPSDGPWGEDRLGAQIMGDADEITIWVDAGIYDMRVQDEDGDTYTLWGIEVDEAGFEWAVTLSDMD